MQVTNLKTVMGWINTVTRLLVLTFMVTNLCVSSNIVLCVSTTDHDHVGFEYVRGGRCMVHRDDVDVTSHPLSDTERFHRNGDSTCTDYGFVINGTDTSKGSIVGSDPVNHLASSVVVTIPLTQTLVVNSLVAPRPPPMKDPTLRALGSVVILA
jgi:hypothetical protein